MNNDNSEISENQSLLKNLSPMQNIQNNSEQSEQISYLSQKKSDLEYALSQINSQIEVQDLFSMSTLNHTNISDSIALFLSSVQSVQKQENQAQNSTLQDKLGILQKSVDQYYEVIKTIYQVFVKYSDQKQTQTEIINKYQSILLNSNARIQQLQSRVTENINEITYTDILNEVRNIYQKIFDAMNQVRQKSFTFLTQSILTSNIAQQSSKASSQNNDIFDENVSQQLQTAQNPLFNNHRNSISFGEHNINKSQNSQKVSTNSKTFNKNFQNNTLPRIQQDEPQLHGNITLSNHKKSEKSDVQPTPHVSEVTFSPKPKQIEQTTKITPVQLENPTVTRQLPPPKFDKFSGDMNAHLWLNRFERSAKRYMLSDEEKLDEALNCMIKNAERWISRNYYMFVNFEAFKSLFLQKFSMSYEEFQDQLMSCKQQKGETNQQFLDRLNIIAGQGDVTEKSLKVYFLNNMSRQDVSLHLQRFLKDQLIDTVELVRQANIYQGKIDQISNKSNPSTNNNNSGTRAFQQVKKPNNFQRPSNQYQSNYQNHNQQYRPYNNNNNNNNYSNNSSMQNYQNKGYSQNNPKKQVQFQKTGSPRINFIENQEQVEVETSLQEQVNSEIQTQHEDEPLVYDCEQQQTPSEGDTSQEGADSNPFMGSMLSFGKMLQQDTETNSLVTSKKQADSVLSQKESKTVQQYFSVENYFKNQNVSLKFEDLVLTSPVYYEQLRQYCDKLQKYKEGNTQFTPVTFSPLANIKPKFQMKNEVCEVEVPAVTTQLFIKLQVQGVQAKGFIDTGASTSCVSKSFLTKNNIKGMQVNKQSYTLVNGNSFIPEGFIRLQIQFDPYLMASVQAAVVENNTFEFLFGLDLFESFNCYTQKQQLFYRNPQKNRYSSLSIYKQKQDQTISSFILKRPYSTQPFFVSHKIIGVLLIILYTVCAVKNPLKQARSKHVISTSLFENLVVDTIKDNQFLHEFTVQRVKMLSFIQSNVQFQKKKILVKQKTYNLGLHHFLRSTTVNKDYQRTLELKKFPIHKKYQLMIIDFPWKYESNKFLAPEYETLGFEQLKQIPIKQISDRNCVYLMWTTGPKLFDCINLISHFKMTYLTCFTNWRKTDKGKLYLSKGSYTRPNYEYVLIASVGDIQQFKRENIASVPQELQAQIQKHSKKPPQFYDVVKKVFKVEKMECIELFARIQKHSYLDLYGDAVQDYFTPSMKILENNYIDQNGITKQFGLNTVNIQAPLQKQVRNFFKYKNRLTTEHLDLIIQPFASTELTMQQLEPVLQVVSQNLQAFAFNEHEVGSTHVLQHTIELEKDSVLKAQNPYRLTGPEREFVKNEIEHLEQLGYIQRDVSPHAAPIVVVKKENNKFRMCVDFRDLNKFTIPHHWPLPQIDVLLTYLYNAQIFSKLDLRLGFFNINLKYEDQYKTSFVCPFGQYKYIRMPFGLRNAPSTFQHAMEEILRPILYKFCLVYIDDVIVYSTSLQQHYYHLQQVFDLIQTSGVKLHPEKCQICVKDVEFLGHKVSFNKVFPKESKTAKIEYLSPPKTVKQLQSFLGFTSYYRKFIKDYSQIAQPLQTLIHKESKYDWKTEQQEAFQKLKTIVTSNPHLKIPDLTAEFTLCTDFCNEGLGAVLSQFDENIQSERPVEYASRTLNIHEQKYGSYEGECLAVIWAFTKFRHYLLGKTFKLYTDNKALSWILTNKNPSPKIARWLLVIQEYDFITEHRSGKNNANADSLSRLATQLCNFTYQNNNFNSNSTTSEQQNVLELSQFLTFNTFTEQDQELYEETEPLYKPSDIGDLTCKICCSPQLAQELLLCEGCGLGYHLKCLQPPLTEIPKNDYYCQQCLELFQNQTLSELDITVDQNALQLLQKVKRIDEFSKTDQVIYNQKISGYVFENKQLFKQLNNHMLLVPTLYQRQQITEEFHENLSNHSGVKRTIQLIQNKYYWPRMEKTVLKYISKCVVCIASNKAQFKQHNDLYSTNKGLSPFQVWSIDLITGLPKTKSDHTIIFVMVCCFSKWTEAVALKNKDSITIATTFYDQVVTRYGKPLQVRTDGGGEFQGSFTILLDRLGTEHIITSPYYARSNGQAERMNKTLIVSLKKNIAQKGLPLNAWDTVLPHILFSLRFCKSRVTEFSPFQIIFAKEPELMSPLDFAQNLEIPPLSKDFIKQYMTKIAKIQQLLFPKVKQNLEVSEIESQDHYRQKLKTFQENITEGQLVFKNVGNRTTKLQLSATGPYKFLKYNTSDKITCDILNLENQKISTVSTSNIVPIPSV